MKINELVKSFFAMRSDVPAERSTLVGISGIDASGKGFISRILCRRLEQLGLRVALISVDGWLNLPSARFDPDDPAGNFYRNALRLDEMFERLVLPLRDRRSVEIDAVHTDEVASEYRKCAYRFDNIDVKYWKKFSFTSVNTRSTSI